MKLKNTIFFTTAATVALVSMPAMAQEADISDDTSVDSIDDDEGGIVVTGSRIRSNNLEGIESTTVVDSEFIRDRNFVNLADAINNLPQFRGSVTPNGGQSGFGGGVNFVNNFGLGSNRTLTLVNGRRVVSSNTPTPFGPGAPGIQVDLNIIPTALIKTTDIVSTAGAPVYGSDAIAGTVNVILDDKYEGLSLNATAGLTEEGDNFTYRFEGVYGTSFADGRGHIQVSSFYVETDGVLSSQRQFNLDNVENEPNTINGFRVDPSLALDTGPADGVPAQVLFNNVRLFPLSNNGVIFGGPLGVSFAGGAQNGLSGTGAFGFDANGNLIPFNPGTRPLNAAGTAATGIRGFGGDGFQFVDFGQITSDLRRFGANVFANYDLTDSINIFTELQYYDARADELVQQPTFNTPLFGTGVSGALTFQSDNPFLTDQARGVLDAAGVTSFTVSRANVGIADLTGFSETELVRGVLGVRGDFKFLNQSDWNFEASVVYGQSEVSSFGQDINVQNFVNATNVTTDGNGNIVCDAMPATPVQAPNAAVPAPIVDANCVPFNFFGNNNTAAALNYVVSDNLTESILEQVVFNVNVGGTLFNFNGNSVGVNIGYEHRNEQGLFNPSEFQELGLGRSAAVTPLSGQFNLDEVFGELYIPFILPSNDSFIHKADVYARGRYVDNTVNGGFFSWAAGGSFAVVEDLEFRGNFTRSFRAPAITELFAPQSTAFAAIPDLCFAAAITGGPNPEARERNCNAFLAAFPNISRPQLAAQATVPIFIGGNPQLDNEQADSYSIGGILRPRWVPNLVITADYINISISDPIVNLAAAAINAACFDNDDFDLSDPANGNAFCSLIQRDANGEVINDPTNPGVLTGQINGFASDYEGIQASLLYDVGLDGLGLPGRVSIRGDLTVVLERVVDNTGVAPSRSDAVLGDPTWSGLLRVSYADDNWGFGVTADYNGEELFSRFDRNPDARQFDQLEDFVTFDVNAFFATDDDFRFNFVVRNLFDRQCQRLNGFCIPGSVNDAFGRTFSASITKEF